MALGTVLLALGITGAIWPKQAKLTDNSTFDYIIVGGGSAGCVVAARLVEDQNCTVLLLEAGDDPSGQSLLPANFALLPSTALDYDFRSTLDTYAAGSQGNYTKITAGKMLGGSGGLNHLLMVRGTKADYDYIAEVTGDDSWSYDNVLPYFKKSENATSEVEVMNKYGEIHGTSGPTVVTRQTHDKEVAGYFEAWKEVGNPNVIDVTAEVGYTQPLLMVGAKGKRQTPALSYLGPVKDNSNLYVSKNTVVSKIIFDDSKTAVGVNAIYDDKVYTFYANKEVILSAGVFNTPQILMLSGVGPKDHLKENNINVVQDLPVGDSLVMPAAVCVVHKTIDHTLPVLNPIKFVSSANPTELPFPVMVGNVALDKSTSSPKYQTYNLLIPHDKPYLTLACRSVYGYTSDICSRFQKQVISRDALYTVVAETEPKSKGTVRLNSVDPLDAPKITTGFYTNPDDLDKMLKNIKDFIQIGNSTFFKKEKAELVGLDFPACADKEAGSDEFWICYILNMTIAPFLYSSSCPMGSVVDGKLKINGLNNIRIVDASVLPQLPHSAPYSTVLMLAEKAADMIKASA